MLEIDLELNRRLRMWRYGVSLSSLVLMSTNDAGEYKTRFYMLFRGVRFVSMPTDFECRRICSSPLGDDTKFEFVTDTANHHLVAGYFWHGQDDGPYNAPFPFEEI